MINAEFHSKSINKIINNLYHMTYIGSSTLYGCGYF